MSGTKIIGLMVMFALVFGALYVLRRLLVACRPGRVMLLFSEKQFQADGKITSYRLLRPGDRKLRTPFEAVAVLGTQPRKADFQVAEAVTRGAEDRLHLSVAATFRIATEAPLLDHAVKRFGGRDPLNVQSSVVDAIDQTMRKQMTRLSVDDILPHPKRLAESVLEECKPLLRKRGVHLSHVEIRKIMLM